MIPFDREKYLGIAREQGVPAALTELHNDYKGWEFDTFEGTDGYRPEDYETLKQVRIFSREIWNLNEGGY